jgi:hypothetical protein
MRHFFPFLLVFSIACLGLSPSPVLADLSGSRDAQRLGNFGVTGVWRGPAERIVAAVSKPVVENFADAGVQCRRAVNAAGREAGIPDHLLSAIARIESGRRSADGRINPWPWSINVEGVDHIYDTREQAVAGVRAFQAKGARSIDVGCMQVNLLHHPTAFPSLELGFEPGANAAYAARFLVQLYRQTGTWPKAVAAYHSFTPELGEAYERKVRAVIGEETQSDMALIGAPLPGSNRFAGVSGSGGGALMLGNRSEAARIIPLAGADGARNLDAYRAAPVRIALRRQ